MKDSKLGALHYHKGHFFVCPVVSASVENKSTYLNMQQNLRVLEAGCPTSKTNKRTNTLRRPTAPMASFHRSGRLKLLYYFLFSLSFPCFATHPSSVFKSDTLRKKKKTSEKVLTSSHSPAMFPSTLPPLFALCSA